ncbi:DUF3052 family protein [Ornithinimicrobium sp. W1665]|uniref:DUF3052 family protein n=1 Tax=Ornithinimicrobium sp. W1665 TaxID=3416666 RepID=UPI003D6C65A6
MDGERNVNEIDTDAGPLVAPARRLGFAPGQIVVEYGDDDDVEEDLRAAVEASSRVPWRGRTTTGSSTWCCSGGATATVTLPTSSSTPSPRSRRVGSSPC